MWKWMLALVVALVVGGARGAGAQEILRPTKPPATTKPVEKVSPGLTRYMGREIAQTMHFAGAPWLTRESRDREEEPAKLMKALGVKRGQTVCDLGCGNGFYTLKLAEAVGAEGKVLAVEIQQEMLAAMRRALTKDGRLVLVEFRAEDPNVPIKPEHKMSKAQVLKELGANGFKVVEQFDGLPWQHVMFFERDDEWRGPAPRE